MEFTSFGYPVRPLKDLNNPWNLSEFNEYISLCVFSIFPHTFNCINFFCIFYAQVQNFLSTSKSTAEAVLENLTEATLNFFNPYRDKRSSARKRTLDRVQRWWEEEPNQVYHYISWKSCLSLF